MGSEKGKMEVLFGTRDVFLCEVEFGVEYCWTISTSSGCKNKSVSLNTIILKIFEKVLMKLCWMPRLLILDNPEKLNQKCSKKIGFLVVRYFADGSDRSSRIIHGWCINIGYLGHPLRLRVKQEHVPIHDQVTIVIFTVFFTGIAGQRVVHSRSACFFSEFSRGRFGCHNRCLILQIAGMPWTFAPWLLLVYEKMVFGGGITCLRYQIWRFFLLMVLEYNICFNHHLVKMVGTVFPILVIRNGTMFHENILTYLT